MWWTLIASALNNQSSAPEESETKISKQQIFAQNLAEIRNNQKKQSTTIVIVALAFVLIVIVSLVLVTKN